MKSVFKVLGIIALVAVIGFSMVSCDNDGGGGGITIDPSLIGTWTNVKGGNTSIFTITKTTWTQYLNGTFYDDGYFTSWNGTTGEIYSNTLKAIVGTVTVLTTNTAKVVLRSPALNPGEYAVTKS